MEKSILEGLSWFVLLYPLIMSSIWLCGSIWHYWTRERKIPYTFNENPQVSILIPAFNEEESIHYIVDKLHKLNYSKLEIIVINDGSTDKTAEIVKEIMPNYPKLRFVNSLKNNGKANALWLGFLSSTGEYVIGVDADAYLDDDAIFHLIAPMLGENNGYHVGAVTGNPKVRNRTNLLTKIQVAEYASIMGMIKRTQQMNNNCMTVSGVCVAFRKTALLDSGLWDKDMITEDIAITWKLHSKKWKIIFNPNAICWMMVPEKIRGLYKQRVRWSLGGVEVLGRHFIDTFLRRDIRNIFLLLEQLLGILWAFSYVILLPFVVYAIVNGDYAFSLVQLKILVTISLLNFLAAFIIERKYDINLFVNYYSVIWYPIVYWYFNVYVTVAATLKYFKNKFLKLRKTHAVWRSPDRGKNIKRLLLEEDNVKIERSKLDKYFFIPLTFLVWVIFLLILTATLLEFFHEFFIDNETLLQSIVGEDNLIYWFIVITFTTIGLFLLYFSNVLFWFPHLPKHITEFDAYKETCKIYKKDSIVREKICKYIEIEADDEIHLL